MRKTKPTFDEHRELLVEKDRLEMFGAARKGHAAKFGAGWPP
ncbi:hypothetical protein AB4Y45_35180 [Paraburkholderia sp. EG287A]